MVGFSKFHFKDLAPDEKIIRVLHRNWFYLLQQFLLMFVIILIFVVGLFYAPIFFPQMFGSEFRPLTTFMENFFVLAVWIYGFLIWVDYYFDVWVITSERIVNIEQKGMFTRKVSELRYSKIQDVTTEVIGFLPTVINYGNVLIQTAGEEDNFVFRTISDPYQIKSIIVDLQKKHEGDANKQLGDIIKQKIGA